MDADALRTAIARLESRRDLAALFAYLGYAPVDEPFDEDAYVIARWRGFRVIALEVPGRERVRALAARLARAGERALAVGREPGALLLSAPRLGSPGGTPLLLVPQRDSPALALQQLELLRPRPRNTALAHAFRVAEVLSSEAAGRRFFEAFRSMLERMTATLEATAPLPDRRMAALLQLTRVLFLYFVQAKGWLAGRPDFLRDVLDDALARQRPFHRSVLHPLFFGTLNRRPADRSGVLKTARIPYLNGGLFEPHPVERRLGPILFSNELWRDAFDTVFERFRFCVREADEVNAIAPDMLGHVFERVMDADERQVTGTFYTPASVVRDLVGKGIEIALAGRVGITPDLARRVVEDAPLDRAEAARVGRVLDTLRILDPATGSGAFLLGAFERLVELRLRLSAHHGSESQRRLRRQVLRHNLFGVDLSPVAVRLAELRLWLAVIADDPVTDFRRVAPLPNLDGVVRQGDSLLDVMGALCALAPGPCRHSAPLSAAVARARTWLFEARGLDRSRATRELREAELAWAAEAVAAGLAGLTPSWMNSRRSHASETCSGVAADSPASNGRCTPRCRVIAGRSSARPPPWPTAPYRSFPSRFTHRRSWHAADSTSCSAIRPGCVPSAFRDRPEALSQRASLGGGALAPGGTGTSPTCRSPFWNALWSSRLPAARWHCCCQVSWQPLHTGRPHGRTWCARRPSPACTGCPTGPPPRLGQRPTRW